MKNTCIFLLGFAFAWMAMFQILRAMEMINIKKIPSQENIHQNQNLNNADEQNVPLNAQQAITSNALKPLYQAIPNSDAEIIYQDSYRFFLQKVPTMNVLLQYIIEIPDKLKQKSCLNCSRLYRVYDIHVSKSIISLEIFDKDSLNDMVPEYECLPCAVGQIINLDKANELEITKKSNYFDVVIKWLTWNQLQLLATNLMTSKHIKFCLIGQMLTLASQNEVSYGNVFSHIALDFSNNLQALSKYLSEFFAWCNRIFESESQNDQSSDISAQSDTSNNNFLIQNNNSSTSKMVENILEFAKHIFTVDRNLFDAIFFSNNALQNISDEFRKRIIDLYSPSIAKFYDSTTFRIYKNLNIEFQLNIARYAVFPPRIQFGFLIKTDKWSLYNSFIAKSYPTIKDCLDLIVLDSNKSENMQFQEGFSQISQNQQSETNSMQADNSNSFDKPNDKVEFSEKSKKILFEIMKTVFSCYESIFEVVNLDNYNWTLFSIDQLCEMISYSFKSDNYMAVFVPLYNAICTLENLQKNSSEQPIVNQSNQQQNYSIPVINVQQPSVSNSNEPQNQNSNLISRDLRTAISKVENQLFEKVSSYSEMKKFFLLNYKLSILLNVKYRQECLKNICKKWNDYSNISSEVKSRFTLRDFVTKLNHETKSHNIVCMTEFDRSMAMYIVAMINNVLKDQSKNASKK